ncbi:hypothetical protein [Thalassospira profundimaris]|uniref:Uncharacterized protein n=1 Tax=Thalassospira profundimaris TaxID=502049 RepID=A0A367WXD0_9PROT|nr:hypothetical protein [Thalassospira profundimaris]RCK46103.1 hypothetical protein TH30_09750 [Thalassospira profundimaris]
MTDKNVDKQNRDRNPDQGTVLDRIKMPPMSGEEALRRFNETSAASDGNAVGKGGSNQSDLAQLHPIMKLVALGGTLLMITAILLGVLYLFGA